MNLKAGNHKETTDFQNFGCLYVMHEYDDWMMDSVRDTCMYVIHAYIHEVRHLINK